MPKFEKNQIDVRGDGRVVIYQRADLKSENWYMRIAVPNSYQSSQLLTLMAGFHELAGVILLTT